jgi:uncharacterized membrane protein YidH (DUF202 family)
VIPPGPLADAGAQAERTALAWRRTGLTGIGVGALLVHAAPTPWSGALVLAAGAAAAAVVAPLRYSAIRRALQNGRTPVSRWSVPAGTAASTAVTALAALAVVAGR